jgi:hypothetical protein
MGDAADVPAVARRVSASCSFRRTVLFCRQTSRGDERAVGIVVGTAREADVGSAEDKATDERRAPNDSQWTVHDETLLFPFALMKGYARSAPFEIPAFP